MLNRLLIGAAGLLAGTLVATPAVLGLSGNSSFSRDIQIPVPSGAHQVHFVEAEPSDSRSRQPAPSGTEDHPGHDVVSGGGIDDHGGLRSSGSGGLDDGPSHDAGDDHGGRSGSGGDGGSGSGGGDDGSGHRGRG
jgi:hypothetical protein